MDTVGERGKLAMTMRGEKGFTTILLAGIMGAFLILFFVVGIDFARIYYVRGELQNAADAAALAGAALILNNNDLEQRDARLEAISFAKKNRAAGLDVVVVTNKTNILSDDNDITVGYWDGTNYNADKLPVNAMLVRPRRKAGLPDSDKRGAVPLIFGSLVGWPVMDIERKAVAARIPQIGPFPICLPSCERATPLDGQWEYEKKEGEYSFAPGGMPAGFKAEDAQTLCTDTSVSSPGVASPAGQHFYLNSSQDMVGFAWTNFDVTNVSTCSAATTCGDNPNPGDVAPYITGDKIPPDICGKAICITNGTATGPLLNDTFKPELAKRAKDHIIPGYATPIRGWRTNLPIVLDCSGSQSCPGDPTGRPYPVQYYANVIITEVIGSSDDPKKGMRLVGTKDPRTITYTCIDKKGVEVTRTRTVTGIGASGVCPSCLDPITEGVELKLVK